MRRIRLIGKEPPKENQKHEHDLRYMREAGVCEDELPYTEIIYDTGDGYGGKLITYHPRGRQFYSHSYGWHIDDSQEFDKPEPCSPEQAVSIIANCNHNSSEKLQAIDRIAELSGIDVSFIRHKRKKYYLFEDDSSIVKAENDCWYVRDREKRQWNRCNFMMGRYYDAGNTFVEIEYDEENEQIISQHNQ